MKGEALDTIGSIAVDDEGFKTTFEMFNSNFLNKEEIEREHFRCHLVLSEASFGQVYGEECVSSI